MVSCDLVICLIANWAKHRSLLQAKTSDSQSQKCRSRRTDSLQTTELAPVGVSESEAFLLIDVDINRHRFKNVVEIEMILIFFSLMISRIGEKIDCFRVLSVQES